VTSRSALLAACFLAAAFGATAATARATTDTFGYTGAEQTFTVPNGVSSALVSAVGARGGDIGPGGCAGGFGATAAATLSVSPGQVLYVEVGGSGNPPGGGGGAAAYNGGAQGGTALYHAAGGGGASDIRTVSNAIAGTLGSRVVTAAGGGGAGSGTSGHDCAGGAAAGTGGVGGNGMAGGQPGTSSAGGSGGAGANSGTAGGPGAGGAGGDGPPAQAAGGGGGGGVYGGGGGGASNTGGGGGGGSSGFGAGTSSTVVGADTSGAPSVSLTYNLPPPGGGGGSHPSNDFQMSKPVVGRNGTLVIALNVPGAGIVTGAAKTKVKARKRRKKAKTIRYGKGTVAASSAGLVTLRIPASRAARKALTRLRKLTVSVAVTYTPVGGSPKTRRTSVAVRK
jgi:hypothetical protein